MAGQLHVALDAVRLGTWQRVASAVVTVRMLWALVAAMPVTWARHWRAPMGTAPVPALAALAAPGWPRLAGLLSLVILLATSWLLPAPVHEALQRKTARLR